LLCDKNPSAQLIDPPAIFTRLRLAKGRFT
jgi:hypothetical protein